MPADQTQTANQNLLFLLTADQPHSYFTHVLHHVSSLVAKWLVPQTTHRTRFWVRFRSANLVKVGKKQEQSNIQNIYIIRADLNLKEKA